MLKNVGFWILAFVLMVAAAVYQRTTGPSHPFDGKAVVSGKTISYSLDRSHGGEGDQKVAIEIGDAPITGVLYYKRYNVPEDFTARAMQFTGDSLVGYLPHQPPAGKLEYYVELTYGDEVAAVPGSRAIITRFRGDVPIFILLPHAALMFIGMMFSVRTGLEAIRPKGNTKSLTLWTIIIIFIGGMILGPIVQKFAFGDFWTGVPFGWDLTDNKTLIMFAAWLIALWRHRGSSLPRFWVLAAAVVVIAAYLIPHSTMGSELDYSTGEINTG